MLAGQYLSRHQLEAARVQETSEAPVLRKAIHADGDRKEMRRLTLAFRVAFIVRLVSKGGLRPQFA
jgi:hypothetical protein